MDFINRATGRTGPLPDGMPFNKIFDLGHIDARIQKHLQRVRVAAAARAASLGQAFRQQADGVGGRGEAG